MLPNNSGFVAGTLVHTDSGLVPIQNIKVGDKVLSKPEDNPDAALCYQRVTAAHRFADKALHMVRFYEELPDSEGNYTLLEVFATPNFPLWQEGVGWTSADHLRCGAEVFLESGSKAVVSIWAPVLRTKQEDMGWAAVALEQLGEMDSIDENGYLIDFRNNKISTPFNYDEPHEDELVSYYHYGADDLTGNCYQDWTSKHTVYNITVENTHTYFVHERGVWVHSAN